MIPLLGSEVVVIYSLAQVGRILRGSEFEVDVLEVGAYSGFGEDCGCQVSAAGSWHPGLQCCKDLDGKSFLSQIISCFS